MDNAHAIYVCIPLTECRCHWNCSVTSKSESKSMATVSGIVLNTMQLKAFHTSWSEMLWLHTVDTSTQIRLSLTFLCATSIYNISKLTFQSC